jgi:hypothetical protein
MHLRFTIALVAATTLLGARSVETDIVPKLLRSDEINTIQLFRQTGTGVAQIDASQQDKATLPLDISEVSQTGQTVWASGDAVGMRITLLHSATEMAEGWRL